MGLLDATFFYQGDAEDQKCENKEIAADLQPCGIV